MKFESSDQLQNHLKKFCQGSDYADLFKLEQKYQTELRNLKQSQGAFKGEEYQQFMARQSEKDQMRLRNENMMSIQDMKEKLKDQDIEFKRLERQDMRKQDDLLDSELNKLKEERMKIRLKKKEDENVLQELLYELEMKKEKEIRARIEKDSIRRALVDLEKAKLTAVGQEKKRELEKLIQERENLRLKEQELVGDIENLESNSKNLDIMRQEELQRMQKVVDGLQFNKKENNKVNEKMVEEKAERMAQLKLRREQLENERARIMNNLEKIKAGDTKGIVGGGSINFGLATAKNILGDMRDLGNYNVPGMREKVRAEEDRLRKMKDDNLGMYKREYMPYDGDEVYGKQNQDGNFPNRVQDYYNNYADKVNNDPNRLNAFRENIEGIANNPRNDISVYAGNKLQDLSMIKQDYMKAGGNDPKFIENMNNLENFYQSAQQKGQQYGPTPTAKPQSAMVKYQNQQAAPPMMVPGMMNDPFANIQMASQMTRPGMIPQGSMNMSVGSTQPDSIDMMLSLKQQENERLRSQINMIKSGNPNMQPPNARGQVHSSGNLGQQSESQLPNPFSIFTQNNEFFMHNEVRSVDLDKEERTLINLTQQEVDALRVLSRVPVGTELYRFKMEQYKQISATRAEIEKIVQEQRLAKMRRKFEQERKYLDRRFDNQRWIDDQRRWILAARLRKEGDNQLANKDYDTNQGFIVHWDYKLGLPHRVPLSQVVFGIYNRNETVYQPKLVDPHDTEVESAQTVRCIVGESNQIFDIPADPDTLMIMEVQFPFSKNLGDNIGRTDTFGWTQVDLFDFKRQLKRGKFKCPLYYGPTDVNISIPEIKNLEPIPGAWIYFRIAYPNDEEYGRVSSLYPDHTMHEYIIPQIHLRNIYGARQDIIEIEQEPDPIPVPNISYQQYPPQTNTSKVPTEDEPEPPPQLQFYQPPRASQANLPPTQEEDLAGGLAVTVVAVLNHVARSHCRVEITLLENTNVIKDENDLVCTFNTSIHNPLTNKIKLNIPPSAVIDNLVQNPHLENMNNKEQGQDIRFQERYRFFRHVLRLYKKNRKDVWLHIKLMELPEPIDLQENQLADTSINYGGLDYQLIGQNYFKIIEDGRIKEREHRIKMYSKLPQIPPNIDYTGAKEMSAKTQVVLNLERIPYSEKDLKKVRDAKKKNKKIDTDISQYIIDNTTKTKGLKGKDNLSPFIENLDVQWNPDAYTKYMGIDVYVDGMRFLPDRVTITKILMDVVNKDFVEEFRQESCLPNLASTQYMPVYEYRRELRKEEIDRTSMLLFTIITYDNTAKVTKRVGYSGIPLFVNQFTNAQPQDSIEENCCIYEGAYLLPIYCQELDRTKRPFNIQLLQSLERIPCASLMVRIKKAALSDDGKRSLSIKEFEEKDWIRKGLFEPRPSYASAVYNTQFIKLTDPENGLFESRKVRIDQNLEELIYLMDKNIKKGGLKQFLDEKLIYTPEIKIIDMMYFAKYDQKVGIKFALDGIHKVPNSKWIYGGLISLNPPGEFYPESEEPGVSSGVKLVSNVNLLSYAESPQFQKEFIYFRNQPFNRYLSVIVDVKAVQMTKNDKKTFSVGWTMVPLFSPDGYVLSRSFQLPLIKGPVDPALLKLMVKRDPWEVFQEQISNTKSTTKLAEFTSIIVRVVDAQREGHFENQYDVDNFDYRYLPQTKIKQWAYTNASKRDLESSRKIYQNFSEFKSAPNNMEMENFNKGIQFDIASSFGLEQYLDITQ